MVDTPAPPPATRPQVLTWFALYCGVLAALGLLTLAIGLGLLAGGDDLYIFRDPGEARFCKAIYLSLGLLFSPLYLMGPFLPRRPFGWTFGIVLLALGMPTCCCIPVSAVILYFWLQPETRAWFNVPPASAVTGSSAPPQ